MGEDLSSGLNGNGNGHGEELIDESLELFRLVGEMDDFTPTSRRISLLGTGVRSFIAAGDDWFDPVGVLERRMAEAGVPVSVQSIALQGLGRTITEGRAAVEIAKRELS